MAELNGTNGNGKNGLFLKVLLGVAVALSVTGIAGSIKIYRDLGVLQSDSYWRIKTLEDQMSRLHLWQTEIERARWERSAWGVDIEKIKIEIEKLKEWRVRVEPRR